MLLFSIVCLPSAWWRQYSACLFYRPPPRKRQLPTEKPPKRQSVLKRGRVFVRRSDPVPFSSVNSCFPFYPSGNWNHYGWRDSGKWTRQRQRCSRNRAHHQGEWESLPRWPFAGRARDHCSGAVFGDSTLASFRDIIILVGKIGLFAYSVLNTLRKWHTHIICLCMWFMWSRASPTSWWILISIYNCVVSRTVNKKRVSSQRQQPVVSSGH